jgi:hypothetical protein
LTSHYLANHPTPIGANCTRIDTSYTFFGSKTDYNPVGNANTSLADFQIQSKQSVFFCFNQILSISIAYKDWHSDWRLAIE